MKKKSLATEMADVGHNQLQLKIGPLALSCFV